MDQAAVFLAGSILTMLGFIVVFAGIILINNLLSTYWKPVKMFRYDTPPDRFLSDEEMAILHEIDKKKTKHE